MSTILNNFSNLKCKKAQLKMQQMIFMIVAVFILFVLVFLIYTTISLNNLKNRAVDSETEKIAGMIIKLASTPEFNFNDQPSSIDADKLMVIRNDKNLGQFLGINSVVVEKIYPSGQGIECTETNYPDCDVITMFTKSSTSNNFASSAFVAWCRKETVENKAYNKCELARMTIEARTVKSTTGGAL